ncbi:MAG: ABC transporter ATP-binding protein [Aestuariivirgaceae bacterium]
MKKQPESVGPGFLARSSAARAFRLFFTAPGSHPITVILCLIVAGLADAVSIGAIVPAVALLQPSAAGSELPLVENARRVFEQLGVEMSIGTLTIFIAAAVTVKSLLSFGALSIAAVSRTRLLTNLRQELIAALLSARWSFFAEQRFGKIANTIGNDILQAGNAYMLTARYIAGLFQTVACMIVALMVSFQAAAVALGIAFLLMITLRAFLGSSYRSGLKHLRRTANLVSLLTDTLNNFKALKTMNRKEPIAALLAKQSKGAQRAKMKQELLKNGLQNTQQTLTAIIFGAGVYFAAVSLKMPLAELLGIGVFVFRIVMTFSRSQQMLQGASEHEAGYWRSLALIEQTRAAVEDDSGRQVPTFDRSCIFEGVGFSHGSKPILTDVSLVIAKGDVTVLQGASGAGKTTIIDLLSGLYRPSVGRVLVDDTDLTDISLQKWRSMIGYVPQELTLLHTSVMENITLGDATIGEERVWQALALAGAADFIREIPGELHGDVGEMGTKLSGGQRQRLALARAIVARPKLLILDEVTSALDPETERDICDRISALAGEFTIVAITHRPAWSRIASRLYKVAGGRVAEVNNGKSLRRQTAASTLAKAGA